MIRVYTPEEDELIRRYYTVKGMGSRYIHKLLPHRSRRSIVNRAKKLHLECVRELTPRERRARTEAINAARRAKRAADPQRYRDYERMIRERAKQDPWEDAYRFAAWCREMLRPMRAFA